MYLKALNAFNEKFSYTDYGFCHHFSFNEIINISKNAVFKKTFPELYNQKPKTSYKYTRINGVKHTSFWWKPDNRVIRIKALRAAIAEIESISKSIPNRV